MIAQDTIRAKVIETVNRDEVLELYRDLMQQQADNYSNLITTLIGVTTALVAFGLLWNLIGARKMIRIEVDKAIADSNSKQFGAFFESLKVTDKMMKSHVEAKVNELRNEIIKVSDRGQANIARLYANYTADKGQIMTSAEWWTASLELYKKIGSGLRVRTCVRGLTELVSRSDWPKSAPDDFALAECIERIQESVPDELAAEKNMLLQKFQALGKKPDGV